MVLLILGCFTICWLPYFIVACSQIYHLIESSSAVAYMAAFTLAMSNSAMNPLIYAWKNSNFRNAFINLLKCKSPDTLEPSQSMRSNLHRKSSSAQHQDQLSSAFPNYSTPPFLQRKIEPMNAMGITFEEDEDKISTHENLAARSAINKHTLTNVSNSLPSVTITIESDMRSSILITTTTLPAVQDDVPIIASVNSTNIDSLKDVPSDNGTLKTGNLIVNKLNYDFDSSDGDFKRFKAKSVNTNPSLAFDGSSKVKSKSANSIAISKRTNKSNSHGSIVDYSQSKSNKQSNETSEGKTLSNKNLFPSFNFGRKNISKSFNSSPTVRVLNPEERNGSSEKVYRKSIELNFNA